MIHIALDYGKRFSHAVAINDSGDIFFDEKIPSSIEGFEKIKAALPPDEPVHSIIEAGWNWGKAFDMFEGLGLNPKLANPVKSRFIAESFTKTDRIDATTHAIMLRAGITPLVHVPAKDVRANKNVLRRRFWLVRLRIALKNRVHSILDRNHLQPPSRTDLFGRYGRSWMDGLNLGDPDGKLLKADLEMLDFVQADTRDTEKWVSSALEGNHLIPLLESLPGIGKIFAALIALEVDTISRFSSASKFASYSGLACSTYSSGGRTFNGGMIPASNRHLRYAFIEAGWTAIRISPYFGAFYERLKARKGANKAIGAVARRLAEIAYVCMKNKRLYEERAYRLRDDAQELQNKFGSGRLAVTLA